MKGKTNNPNGRPPGKPNKVTKELREMIRGFLGDNYEKIVTDFDKLEPKDRAKLYVDLLQYAIPKYQSIEMEPLESEQQQIVIHVMDEETKKMIESGDFFDNIES